MLCYDLQGPNNVIQPFSSLVSLASYPFLEFAKPVPTSGPLHLPFPLLVMPLPQTWLLPTIQVSTQMPPPQIIPGLP